MCIEFYSSFPSSIFLKTNNYGFTNILLYTVRKNLKCRISTHIARRLFIHP